LFILQWVYLQYVGAKLVGMEYETWFLSATAGEWAGRKVTPSIGTYSSHDPSVIDLHLRLMGMAGIDFIMVDWSNQRNPADWPSRPDLDGIVTATDLLFDRALANPIGKPQIAIMTDCLDNKVITQGWAQQTADIVYSRYVTGSRARMYFSPFDGKPLLGMYLMTPAWSPNCGGFNDARFSVRYVTGFTEAQNLQNDGVWSWVSRNPIGITTRNGLVEAATVTPATCQYGAGGEPRSNGDNYAQQWDRAIAANPYIILICQWNEYAEETSPECSNEVEPTKEYSNFYLNMTETYINKYKGKK